MRRPLHWDGLFTIGLPGPRRWPDWPPEIRDARPGGSPSGLITELSRDTDLGPWERAGLTWAVTFFGLEPTKAGVRAVIDAGPRLPARPAARVDTWLKHAAPPIRAACYPLRAR